MKCSRCGACFGATYDYPYATCHACNRRLDELIRSKSGVTGDVAGGRAAGALAGLCLLGSAWLVIAVILAACRHLPGLLWKS